MKKKLRTLCVFIMFICACIVLTGCSETENTNNTQEINSDEISEQIIPIGDIYSVKMDDDVVYVITDYGSNKTTVKYIFSDDQITKIETVQEYESSAIAKTNYEQLKATKEVTVQYSDITLEDSKITLITQQELIDALKTYTKNEFYELQKITYGVK